jgi:hypothetical protein
MDSFPRWLSYSFDRVGHVVSNDLQRVGVNFSREGVFLLLNFVFELPESRSDDNDAVPPTVR